MEGVAALRLGAQHVAGERLQLRQQHRHTLAAAA